MVKDGGVGAAGILQHVRQQWGSAKVTRFVDFLRQDDGGPAVPTPDGWVEADRTEGVAKDVSEDDAVPYKLLSRKLVSLLRVTVQQPVTVWVVRGKQPNFMGGDSDC